MSGDAYGGLLCYGDFREYLGIRLREPLLPGREYKVWMYVSLAPGAISEMGFYFSRTFFVQNGTKPMSNFEPQVVNPKDRFLTERKWTRIEGIFVAKGGEKYVIIGSFAKSPKSVKVNAVTPGFEKPYYYIDNVSTIPVPIKKRISITDSVQALDNIYFKLGSAELLPASHKDLDKLVDYLQKSPSYNLEIIGHTDDSGTDSTNQALSLERAQSVRNYLTSKGVRVERLTATGKGATDPLVENDRAANRRLNRRVNWVLTKR